MGTKTRSLLFGLILSGLMAWGLAYLTGLHVLLAWFGGVNLVTFTLMGWDKLASVSVFGRTPERTFFILALLGGFPGLFAARKLFNHKTSKRSFVVTMWALFGLQLAVVGYYLHTTEYSLLGMEKKDLPAQNELVE